MTSSSSNGLGPSDTAPLITGMQTDYKTVEMTADFSTAANDSSTVASDLEHKTTVWQTFIHLLKGYIGPGCLSLPWAVSQLGIKGGFVAIASMSLWSSYNCWTVVKIKRYIETESPPAEKEEELEKASQASLNSNVTYPDVGEFLYGERFQSYVAACICTQQLAICTVFLSFIGENLLAVLERLDSSSGLLSSHVGVITVALPFVMALSFLPSLKSLSPVMAAGTVLLLISFGVLGLLVGMEWEDRPSETPSVNLPQVPLAVCAILYSYEGICLILPIESAMKEPQHFETVFWTSMALVALILASVSSLCVMAFGHVTNGSVTAFLLEAYGDDDSIILWVMVANTAVSLSVLLTYPLQLFPAIEIMGPWLSPFLHIAPTEIPDENDLEGFEPLPTLHEDAEVVSVDSLPDTHLYESEMEPGEDKDEDVLSQSAVMSIVSVFPEMTMPGDSPQLRAVLVLLTYAVAVVVPNVQALISLAGALAGSSTALLIPPLLELAWIRHLEDAEMPLSPDPSGRSIRRWTQYLNLGKWWKDILKCYFLLMLGIVFFAIGTYASLADIVAIYRSS